MPPADTGIWLPPQRTFSSLVDGSPLEAERTHAPRGRQSSATSRSTTVSVRAFRQHVDDQIVTLFGVDAPVAPATLGHYFVAQQRRRRRHRLCSAGVRTAIAGPRARFGRVLVARAPNAARSRRSRYLRAVRAGAGRDPSTSASTTCRRRSRPRCPKHRRAWSCSIASATRFARQRLGRRGAVRSTRASTSRCGSRCRSWTSAAKWEMLVAVRNFFRDTAPRPVDLRRAARRASAEAHRRRADAEVLETLLRSTILDGNTSILDPRCLYAASLAGKM